ncbi:hypothetical protein NDN08_001860 [Rhodosorus marinus]|uniref:MRG domain-containing protein n=1 Tax=Rhodosorus marinus TaxID=101924 RepID=A0AAV8UUV7_9RHOD|nr:hypothetical protein NDN08_001860 [Rhodosorus marinus]
MTAAEGKEGTKIDFEAGEKVFVSHGNLLYEAKVVHTEVKNSETRFKIHYLGWKDKWDEVVKADRLSKFTEESVQLKKSLLRKIISPSRARDRSDPDMSLPAKMRKVNDRKGVGEGIPSASALSSEQSSIVLHSTLKRQLVDDWEFVTKDHKLVPLPRDPSVSAVLSTWLLSNSRRGIADKACKEIAEGLREYFDIALGTMLLYKFERIQYNQVIHGSEVAVKPSKVYGAEHLLRLIVKLPTLLVKARVNDEKQTLIFSKMNDLAKFLHKNGKLVFLPEYSPAGEDYIAKTCEE